MCRVLRYAKYAEHAEYAKYAEQAKPSKQSVNSWVRSTFGNVCVNISEELLVWYFSNLIM